jgi:oligosaccharide repeat unit polymerase
MLNKKIFHINRDVVLIVYCIIALVYGMLAPLASINNNGVVTLYYIDIFILFFLTPLFIIYKAFPSVKIRQLNVNVSNSKTLIFSFLLCLSALIFLYIAVDNGIFFRRIGHEALARASLDLSRVQLIFTRLFQETAIFITMVLHILFVYSNKRKRLSKISTLFILCYLLVILTYFLINSRMQLMILILSHFCIFASFNKISRTIPKLIAMLFIAFWTVLILRGAIVTENVSVSSIISEVISENPISNRLNGLKIIIELNEEVSERGMMYGEAWRNSIMIYYYMIFDENKYNLMKINMETTPKVLIYQYYKGEHIKDSPSSIVSDVYPNFGIIGLVILGGFIGMLLYLIKSGLNNTTNLFKFLLSLYLIPLLFQFEKEFISLIFMVFKYSFVLFLVYIYRPFSILRREDIDK